MQRSTIAPALPPSPEAQFKFGTSRLLQGCVFTDSDEGIDARIYSPDSVQDEPRQLHWREFAFPELLSNFLNGSENELAAAALQKIFSCRRRFPNVPMFARISPTRNWFSERTVARLKRPYSTDKPQQPPL